MSDEPVLYQSGLGADLAAFVAHKRALARRYDTEERSLRLFDRYVALHGVTSPGEVTPQLVETFLASRPRARPRSYNHLRGVLERFFGWLVEQEVLLYSPVRVPPRRVTGKRLPYLFSPDEARRLFALAARLPDQPRAPLRGPTYELIFALLYGLGLRVGEVSRLTGADVDLERELLVVRKTKFQKNRLVPFGPRMAARLAHYDELREARFGYRPPALPFFSFGRGQPINPCTISQTFHHLVPALELTVPPGVAYPRLHDLRHSFAVARLLRWYREGVNPAERLMALATFLGHVGPVSTAEYLTITGDLLAEADRRFRAFALPIDTGGAR
jgi:integrase